MEWVLKGVPDLLRLVYSATVVSFWRTVRNQNVWLKPAAMMRWYMFGSPHAHNPDAVVRGFYAALKSAAEDRSARDSGDCWRTWRDRAIQAPHGKAMTGLSNQIQCTEMLQNQQKPAS